MLALSLNRATLTVDGTLAERELRERLADVQFGKVLGKALFINFSAGKIELAAGYKGLTLVTIEGAVIRGNTIELPLKPFILLKPFFNGIVTKIAGKFHPLASAVTGAKPVLVLDLSKLPSKFSVTVDSIAFVPGAAIVTLGPSGVRYAR
jgi:hypothetical protein